MTSNKCKLKRLDNDKIIVNNRQILNMSAISSVLASNGDIYYRCGATDKHYVERPKDCSVDDFMKELSKLVKKSGALHI